MTSIRRKAGIEANLAVVKVKYESEWEDGKHSIIIQSPSHGEKIPDFGFSGKRHVYGVVIGFPNDQIKKLGLQVKVSIITDIEYPQGTADVKEGGSWILNGASFRGSHHIVQAELTDKDGNSLGLIARADVEVVSG